MLDLFGGSGAIAFELLSNGAGCAVISEKDPLVASLIAQNAVALKVEVEVINADALSAIEALAAAGRSFDIIIAAPPYGLDLQQQTVDALEKNAALLAPGGLVFVQREAKEPEPVASGTLVHTSSRSYGRTIFDFFSEN